jgi:peptidyl-prolyl cis-trans isomerase C
MRARTWSLATLVGAAAVALGPVGAPAQAPATPTAQAAQVKPVALVNGEPITRAELEAVLSHDGPRAVQLPENQLLEMRRAALDMMIQNILWAQFVRQHGPRVDPGEVSKAVAEFVEALKKQGKTLPDFLRESAQTEAELKDDITVMLQWRAYVKTRLSEDDLKRYYLENKDFFDRVLVRASHILLRVPATADEAERQRVRNKLLAIRQEVVSGKLDFAAAATKFSECPSAPSGGDIGFFPRKGVVLEPFARAAFSLPVGQVSDVIQSDYGLHLIKVTERKPGEPSDFAKIKEVVEEIYVSELRQNIIAQMIPTSKIETNLP